MKRFVANFNDGHGMNIQADRMETTQDGTAHLSEQGEKQRERTAL